MEWCKRQNKKHLLVEYKKKEKFEDSESDSDSDGYPANVSDSKTAQRGHTFSTVRLMLWFTGRL
jgi:hypothetical protein